MTSLSATRAFKDYHFEVPHNLSKNEVFLEKLKVIPFKQCFLIEGKELLFEHPLNLN